MNKKISEIAENALNGGAIERDDARFILACNGGDIYDILYWANKIRHKHFGDNISLCAILSAKQGSCTEDCRFCTQSSFYETDVATFPLVDADHASGALREAEKMGADSLGLVTSGYSLNHSVDGSRCDDSKSEFDKFCGLAAQTAQVSNIALHASVGCMSEEMACRLAASGIKQINHNLETSRKRFPDICTSHTYDDRVTTIRNAKTSGLKICSGGIFGIGETDEDVLDLAFTLRELDVDTVPLNFLNPIPGTPLGAGAAVKPLDALRTVALFRFVLPAKEIKLAGGREETLRSLQSWMFYAGANSTMIGDYLTTPGRLVNEDIQMIGDLGLVCGSGLPC